MTIEQEMELWENRSKDDFGKLLANLKNKTKAFFIEEKDEYGFNSTPISDLVTLYAVDGNREYIYRKAYSICENWDILKNDNVANILKSMKKLLNN